MSNSLCGQCTKSSIIPSVQSDHSMVTIEFDTGIGRRGPGIWKFNNELLSSEHYCENITNLVQGICRVYNHLSPKDIWELIKFETTQYTRAYMTHLAETRRQEKFVLYEVLQRMESEPLTEDWGEDLLRNIERVSNELKAFETIDAKRAAFRCRMEWQCGGEVSSKYFFDLEKRNYVTKTMYVARKPEGELTKD